ncbi:hypothetical protein [Rhizobium gallicum]|nr:hypothetical protein [Rhizobium gallicum]
MTEAEYPLMTASSSGSTSITMIFQSSLACINQTSVARCKSGRVQA